MENINRDFRIEVVRAHLTRKNCAVILGWFADDNPDNRTVKVVVNGKSVPFETEIRKDISVRQRYLNNGCNVGEEYFITVPLGDEWGKINNFKIISMNSSDESEGTVVYERDGEAFSVLERHIPHNVELVQYENGCFHVRGWVIGDTGLTISVDENGKNVPTEISQVIRSDVSRIFPDAPDGIKPGFEITFCGNKKSIYHISFTDGSKLLSEEIHFIEESENQKGLAGFKSNFVKTVSYLKENGLKATVKKVKEKINKENVPERDYDIFLRQNALTEEEIKKQKNAKFSTKHTFSIVVPLYKTPEKYLREMIDSVLGQTCGDWELCLADGSGKDSPIVGVLEEYKSKDKRIKVKTLEANLGISGNTNAAIEMASGDFILLADHDDVLAQNAIYECASALENDNEIDVIYSDEDKIDMSGKYFFEPNFKPDFSIDYLCSVNYICHLFGFSRKMYDLIGGFRAEYDGAQDHDLILRYTEKAKKIHHIRKVLYHWRCHMNSTAANPESKLYAFENGAKAVTEHYRRIGVPARVEKGDYYGLYHTVYEWKEEPLVSVIVPTKDHSKDLRTCIESVEKKSSYKNLEWVIVENNSTEEETWKYYAELKAKENVKLVVYDGAFNYSKINNFGRKHASGEYLLLLNNDTEMIAEDSIREMLGTCMREDVGIVGARLYYNDNTIQHAGVVIGFGGIAGHTFINQPRGSAGYMSRICVSQNYSAVTAACMMVKAACFDEVGGLCEDFAVAFNDIDFCLKVRGTGKLVVYNPYAEFYHYESKSRGLEDTQEKIDRFQSEIDRFNSKWDKYVRNGDPYYNPNLTLNASDFSLKIIM